MSQPPRKRLPRHQRAAPAERPAMKLTERDVEIIRAVNAYRALLGGQVEALFFGSRSTAQYRLQRLYQHEFLDRYFLSVVSGSPAASPVVYTLSKRGAKLLSDRFGYTQAELRLPKTSGYSWGFLEHLLAINQVRVAVQVACREQGWVVEDWQDEPRLKADADYVELSSSGGRHVRKPVLPDGYFCLGVPQGRARFFLEVDRGTEPHSKFKPQIEVYQAYALSGGYQARYQASSLRILVVAASDRRLAHLKQVTLAAGGDRKYYFTSLDKVTPQEVLTAPIWQPLEDSQPVPLIPGYNP